MGMRRAKERSWWGFWTKTKVSLFHRRRDAASMMQVRLELVGLTWPSHPQESSAESRVRCWRLSQRGSVVPVQTWSRS